MTEKVIILGAAVSSSAQPSLAQLSSCTSKFLTTQLTFDISSLVHRVATFTIS